MLKRSKSRMRFRIGNTCLRDIGGRRPLPLASSPASKNHLRCVDAMRACAAIYVVIHHATLGFGKPDSPTLLKFILGICAHGNYAVDLFIVLSGFCLMIPVVRSNYVLQGGMLRFYRRRVQRILPPYFLTVGGSLMMIGLLIGHKTGALWDCSVPVTIKGLLTHVLLIQDLFADTHNQINYALWSIAVEWRIYLFFPFFVFCWRTLGAAKTTLVTVTLAILLTIATRAAQGRFPALHIAMASCPHYFALFGFGMLAADIAISERGMSRWQTRLPWGAVLTVMTLVMLVIDAIAYHGHGIPWQLIDMTIGVWAACLLVVATGQRRQHRLPRYVERFLNWPPLVFIGTFAYSIYLIHAPLLQMLSQYMIAPFHLGRVVAELALVFLGVPLITVTAYAFFLICEKPFLTRREVQPVARSDPHRQFSAELQSAA